MFRNNILSRVFLFARNDPPLSRVGGQLFFYGWWDWRFLSLIMFSTAVDYKIGLALSVEHDVGRRKALLIVSLAANLGLLRQQLHLFPVLGAGMSRKLLSIVAFLIVLFAGDRLGGLTLGAILDNSKIPIAQMYAGRSESDVLLLGDSRAYRHFDTKNLSLEFGRPVANLSHPGISTLTSLALLEDFIDLYGSPKILLVELSGLIAGPKAAANLRSFSTRSARISALLRDTHTRLYYAGRISNIFNFNNNFFLNAAHKVFFPMPEILFQSELTEPVTADTIAAWPGGYFNTKPKNVMALKAMIDIAERRKIELQLVISPILPAFAERNGYRAWRQEIATALGDARIWDYGNRPPLGAGFFKDPVHLNARGVAVFMDLLRRDGFFDGTGQRPAAGDPAAQTAVVGPWS